jgi:hypothetical protein
MDLKEVAIRNCKMMLTSKISATTLFMAFMYSLSSIFSIKREGESE